MTDWPYPLVRALGRRVSFTDLTLGQLEIPRDDESRERLARLLEDVARTEAVLALANAHYKRSYDGVGVLLKLDDEARLRLGYLRFPLDNKVYDEYYVKSLRLSSNLRVDTLETHPKMPPLRRRAGIGAVHRWIGEAVPPETMLLITYAIRYMHSVNRVLGGISHGDAARGLTLADLHADAQLRGAQFVALCSTSPGTLQREVATALAPTWTRPLQTLPTAADDILAVDPDH